VQPNNPQQDQEEAMYLKLMPILTTLLGAQASNETKLMDLRSNVGNLLTRYKLLLFPL
jgi:hypothetical protein